MNTSNHHAIIDADTGEILFVEKARNTFGGWVNMTRRIEERFGDRMRPAESNADDLIWVCGAVRFRTEIVNVL